MPTWSCCSAGAQRRYELKPAAKKHSKRFSVGSSISLSRKSSRSHLQQQPKSALDGIEFDQNEVIKNAILWKGYFGPVHDGVLLPNKEKCRSKRKRVVAMVCTAGGIRSSSKSEKVSSKRKGFKNSGELLLSDSERQFVDMIETAAVVGHNAGVVRLLGIVAAARPLTALIEHMPVGDLRTFLSRPDASKMDASTKLQMMTEVASGIRWIVSKNISHRHVAAENVLLDAYYKAKLTLPMTYIKHPNSFFSNGKPTRIVRWMAPETLINGVFNEKSDAWSFGIFSWEIFQQCQKVPYYESSNTEAFDLIVQGITYGQENDFPDNALYSALGPVLVKCWGSDPNDRPSFERLVHVLQDATMEAWRVEQEPFPRSLSDDLDSRKDSDLSQVSWQSGALRSARCSVASDVSSSSFRSFDSDMEDPFESSRGPPRSVSGQSSPSRKLETPHLWDIASGALENEDVILHDQIQTIFEGLENATDEYVEVEPSKPPLSELHLPVEQLKEYWTSKENIAKNSLVTLSAIPVQLIDPRFILVKMCHTLAFDEPLKRASQEKDRIQQMLHVGRWYFHLIRSGILHRIQLPAETGDTYCCSTQLEDDFTEALIVCEQAELMNKPTLVFAGSDKKSNYAYKGTMSKEIRFVGDSLVTECALKIVLYVGGPYHTTNAYEMNFPDCTYSGFATNAIRTELLGTGGIICPQTGLQLDFEFDRRELASAKSNPLMGELFKLNACLGTCMGTWTGTVKLKLDSDVDEFVLFDESTTFRGGISLARRRGSTTGAKWDRVVAAMSESKVDVHNVKSMLETIEVMARRQHSGRSGRRPSLNIFKMRLNALHSHQKGSQAPPTEADISEADVGAAGEAANKQHIKLKLGPQTKSITI